MIQRTLTAVALLGGFLAALLWLPHLMFALLCAVLVGLAALEWARLSRLTAPAGRAYTALAVCGFGSLVWSAQYAAGMAPPWHSGFFAAATLFWIVVAPIWMARGIRSGAPRLLASAGLVVVLPGALALVVLPPMIALGALGLVWVADSAAYFAGRVLGRNKLAPRISPGKTWEGVFGGLLGVLLYVIICGFTVSALEVRLEGSAAWLLYLSGAGLLFVVSIIGDLFESAMKRQASVKDSGTLLPGHGGVLDRIDSSVAVLPVAALITSILSSY